MTVRFCCHSGLDPESRSIHECRVHLNSRQRGKKVPNLQKKKENSLFGQEPRVR